MPFTVLSFIRRRPVRLVIQVAVASSLATVSVVEVMLLMVPESLAPLGLVKSESVHADCCAAVQPASIVLCTRLR